MKAEKLTMPTASRKLTIQENAYLIFRQTFHLLAALVRFLLVMDSPAARTHGRLIRALFGIYLVPAIFFFGPQAIFLMAFYQIVFKLLLRAAL